MKKKAKRVVNDALAELNTAKQMGIAGSIKASYAGLRTMFGVSPYVAMGIDVLMIGVGIYLFVGFEGIVYWLGILSMISGAFGVVEKVGRWVTA